MGKMYEDWNKLFCDQLVEEIRKFEKCKTKEQLCVVKDLIEVTNGLQEMEMDGAIRRIAEDRYGYDSSTGRFRSMPGQDSYDTDMALEFMEMFNASRGGRGRGRSTGRRRDSRGRFIGNMGGPMPNVYYPSDPDLYPWEFPNYMMNDGRYSMRTGDTRADGENREFSGERSTYTDGGMQNAGRGGRNGSRGGSRGGRSGGSYNVYPYTKDDEMYLLRQQDGRPIMTPYNAHDPHDIPKKLTKEQYEEWMHDLMGADGSSGPHWTVEQTKTVQQKKGVSDINEYAWWAAMNAVYSDFCEFFAKRNMNNIDTYADLAKVFWFEDDDAVGGGEHNEQKLAAYYTAVVEH